MRCPLSLLFNIFHSKSHSLFFTSISTIKWDEKCMHACAWGMREEHRRAMTLMTMKMIAESAAHNKVCWLMSLNRTPRFHCHHRQRTQQLFPPITTRSSLLLPYSGLTPPVLLQQPCCHRVSLSVHGPSHGRPARNNNDNKLCGLI